jgi:hypothetical protein
VKGLAVAISIVALLGSSLACGQSDSQAAESRSLDRVVPRLPNGLSVEEVEERLGEPRDEFETEGSEVVLSYGSWQVVFHPSLYKRTRYYREGYWPADKPVGPLDRQVHELPLGSSRATVEHELGKSEAWQVFNFNRWERVWYGNGRWKLTFRDKKLSGKQRPDN